MTAADHTPAANPTLSLFRPATHSRSGIVPDARGGSEFDAVDHARIISLDYGDPELLERFRLEDRELDVHENEVRPVRRRLNTFV